MRRKTIVTLLAAVALTAAPLAAPTLVHAADPTPTTTAIPPVPTDDIGFGYQLPDGLTRVYSYGTPIDLLTQKYTIGQGGAKTFNQFLTTIKDKLVTNPVGKFTAVTSDGQGPVRTITIDPSVFDLDHYAADQQRTYAAQFDTPGSFNFTFEAKDSANNQRLPIVIPVIINEPATGTPITTSWSAFTAIDHGSTFNPLSDIAFAQSEQDKTPVVADHIKVDSNVDTAAPGFYTVLYTVTNTAGTQRIFVRHITVTGETAPTLFGQKDGTTLATSTDPFKAILTLPATAKPVTLQGLLHDALAKTQILATGSVAVYSALPASNDNPQSRAITADDRLSGTTGLANLAQVVKDPSAAGQYQWPVTVTNNQAAVSRFKIPFTISSTLTYVPAKQTVTVIAPAGTAIYQDAATTQAVSDTRANFATAWRSYGAVRNSAGQTVAYNLGGSQYIPARAVTTKGSAQWTYGTVKVTVPNHPTWGAAIYTQAGKLLKILPANSTWQTYGRWTNDHGTTYYSLGGDQFLPAQYAQFTPQSKR